MSTAALRRGGTELAALADAVLLPGFVGPDAPDWLRRRIGGSLAGVCLFGSNIVSLEQLRALTDSLRGDRDDVVVSIDEEGGGVTRLDASTGSRFPGAAALGRVDDVALTQQIGRSVGRLVAQSGITLNFAPCADVMVDRLNPVIGIRSFGAEPALVARHTAAFVTGHQSAGVAACAKHYPGHGDTDVDTHLSVAVIDSDLESLRTSALLPFAAAIDAGVASVMAGHLLVPAVDDLPASVSGRWLTDILRIGMGFTGAVVTDALEMAAISRQYGMAQGAVMAIEAGADLLCLGADDASPELLDLIAGAVVDAVRSGRIAESRLAQAADRVLALSRRPGAAEPVDSDADHRLSQQAAQRALHVVGPLSPLRQGVLVVRCEAGRNFAIGVVPWGPMTVLPPTQHATEIVVGAADVDSFLVGNDAPQLGDITSAPQVIVVTSDRHRYPWMGDVVGRVRAIRPDAVLLEMGTGDVQPQEAPAIASFGSGLVNTRAVVDLLRAGRSR
jgi:beta-N-acetylhexosaminidase